MSTQRQVPGGPYVNEVATQQRQVPGGPFVNETVATGGGYTHPTLSNARMDPLSASGGIPKVDWAFS